MFNHVSPYRYRLLTVYLYVGDNGNADLFACGCRTWIVSTSPAFMRSSASHPAGPQGLLSPKTVNRASIAVGGKYLHNLHISCQNLCDSSTTSKLCLLEHSFTIIISSSLNYVVM